MESSLSSTAGSRHTGPAVLSFLLLRVYQLVLCGGTPVWVVSDSLVEALDLHRGSARETCLARLLWSLEVTAFSFLSSSLYSFILLSLRLLAARDAEAKQTGRRKGQKSLKKSEIERKRGKKKLFVDSPRQWRHDGERERERCLRRKKRFYPSIPEKERTRKKEKTNSPRERYFCSEVYGTGEKEKKNRFLSSSTQNNSRQVYVHLQAKARGRRESFSFLVRSLQAFLSSSLTSNEAPELRDTPTHLALTKQKKTPNQELFFYTQHEQEEEGLSSPSSFPLLSVSPLLFKEKKSVARSLPNFLLLVLVKVVFSSSSSFSFQL